MPTLEPGVLSVELLSVMDVRSQEEADGVNISTFGSFFPILAIGLFQMLLPTANLQNNDRTRCVPRIMWCFSFDPSLLGPRLRPVHGHSIAGNSMILSLCNGGSGAVPKVTAQDCWWYR